MEFSANVPSAVKTEARDAFTETIKMVEDDFFKFNEIVNQNLRIENDIEKQLEKEDKKCTFLKHTIGSLKKQLNETERICTHQRNYIFDLQMEIEHISSTIYEQMEVKRIAYPEEDAKPYREMVNLAQRMVDYITNFKTVIQQNIDDCVNRNEETNYWKKASNQLFSRISELTSNKNQLQLEIDQLKNCVNDHSLENINKNISRLQEIHEELKKAKISQREVFTEKNKLNFWKQQIITESTDKKTFWLKNQENFEKLKTSSTNGLNLLRTEISSTKQQYYNTINEMKTCLDFIEKKLKKLECLTKEKSDELEDMNRRETALKYQYEIIISNIKRMSKELSELEESSKVLEEQDQFAKNMYDSMKQHTSTLQTTILENENYLRNLIEELAKLESNSDISLMDYDELKDTFKFIIPVDDENVKDQNIQLEKRHKQLMQETQDFHIVEDELKFKLNACDVEIDFLNLLHNKMSVKMNEEQKVDEEMNNKIAKCIENVTELSNIVLEKNLLLDSVRAEVQKCFSLVALLEYKIKAQKKENAEYRTKLSQIEEQINNEEKNLQSKTNLLEDLEKNTFPKTKIPAEWLQSLQQQKNEYEKLKAERTELEEKRNKLKEVEKDSTEKTESLKLTEIFKDTNPKKQRSDLEMKSAAYKIFKERILKKSGVPLSN